MNFQAAQDMMRNMSPEQQAQIQNMVQNMTPEQRDNMQRMAANMGYAPPAGAAPSPSGASQYTYNAAMMLKNEGNQLHQQGNLKTAIEKYERGRTNLASQSTAQAIELRNQCALNAAMCHLKLEQHSQCVTLCSEVLRASGPNLKASYRRGQAYLGQSQFPEAVRDLEQALSLCPSNDEAQRKLIQSKIDEGRKGLGDAPVAAADTDAPTRAKASVSSYNGGRTVIEEVDDETSAPAASRAAPASPSSSAPSTAAPVGHPSTWTAAQRAAYMQQSMNDPEQLRRMADMMENLTDEQYEEMKRMPGMPAMDRDMVKQAAQMMKHMSPEQMKMMSDMAAQQTGAAPGMGASAPVRSTPAQPSGSSQPAPASGPAPGGASGVPTLSKEQMEMAEKMMSNMSEEQLASMMEGMSGMMPDNMKISPEMLKASSEMMKNMKPEDLRKMQEMAAAHGGTGVPNGAGGPASGMPDMSTMLNNPAAMEQAMAMMKNMDEDSIVQMMKMSQAGMDEATARKVARQMKQMDERSLKLMMGLASTAQQASQRLGHARQWLAARPMLALGILVLLLAVLLRYFGVM